MKRGPKTTKPTVKTHDHLLNQRQLAKAIGLSVQSIATWDLPHQKIGRQALYDLSEVIPAILERERQEPGTLALQAEQALLTRERRIKIEMENKVRDGQLFDVREGEDLITKWVTGFRGQLESWPDRLSMRLAAMHDFREIKTLLRTEVREAFVAASKWKFIKP